MWLTPCVQPISWASSSDTSFSGPSLRGEAAVGMKSAAAFVSSGLHWSSLQGSGGLSFCAPCRNKGAFPRGLRGPSPPSDLRQSPPCRLSVLLSAWLRESRCIRRLHLWRFFWRTCPLCVPGGGRCSCKGQPPPDRDGGCWAQSWLLLLIATESLERRCKMA